MTTTPNTLIFQAFKDAGIVGVGQTPLAEDTNDAFTRLNWMLAQWQIKRWLVYHLVELSKVSTGANSYTIGSGGDFDIDPRPNQLEAAFLRQVNIAAPNQVDFPIKIIKTFENYSQIRLKQLSSFTQYVFFDTGFPTGTIYFYPVPTASIYSMHLIVKMVLSQFTSLAQSISLPAEYFAAIHYNLAVRLCTAYGRPIPPDLAALALDSLNVLREANTQISTLVMPTGLTRAGGYNIYSDNN